MPLVDLVVVSYNSATYLHSCLEGLVGLDWVEVVVVDNASCDESLEIVADLPIRTIALTENVGFAGGCNAGWRASSSPYVLFLNPDARLEAGSLRRLVDVLETNHDVGIVVPKICAEEGSIQYSLRRFPRVLSTFAQALYLHRLAPRAAWTDEVIRREEEYESPGVREWASGACMLLSRSVLERLGGWDDGFFLYCEDIDICRRVSGLNLNVYYEPAAIVTHSGGASAPRSATLPILASSRLRYARLHRSRLGVLTERVGIALEAATHGLGARGGKGIRAAYLQCFRQALRSSTQTGTGRAAAAAGD